MRPCELTPTDIALFSRKIFDAEEFETELTQLEQRECTDALAAALAVVGSYTGLDMSSCKEEDLTYAVKVLAAEMMDNHQITAQYTGKNPTAMQIMDLHSTNLLPSVEE